MGNSSVEKPSESVEKPSALKFNVQKSPSFAISCQQQKRN